MYGQLQQKERDLILAAELGKALLEKNEELSKQNNLDANALHNMDHMSLKLSHWSLKLYAFFLIICFHGNVCIYENGV